MVGDSKQFVRVSSFQGHIFGLWMNEWAHVKCLWNFNRCIVLLESSRSTEHTEGPVTVSSAVPFKSNYQNLRKLERAHSLDASSSTLATNAKVVFDVSLVVEQSVNTVVNI